jgi:phage terminase large subunit
MEDNQFKDTTATKRIFNLTKRIRAVAGGTSASKTISILIWCIDYAQSVKDEIITVVAESVPHLQLGAIRDFQNIMKSNGYWNDANWNETKHIYTFNTNTFIEFISFDKFGKAHGPRRDILFINEANNIPYLIVDQLITRTRKIVWMDWNPSEEFYFYTEMLGKRDDIDFITLTYLDNEALDEVSKSEIESHRGNKEWWTVYGEGKLGVITTRIYRDWQIIDEIPHEAKLVARWLDFGYTNDPSSIGDVYYYNGGYIVDEQLYQKGMLNKGLADFILTLEQPQTLVIADSAEPKSIDEIRSFGVNIVGVSKHRGESKSETFVKWSIGMVQNQRISVTRRSFNTIKEYRNYLWLTDKNGKILNMEDPKFANHSMSGIRYVISTIVNNATGGMEEERADRLLSRLKGSINQTR